MLVRIYRLVVFVFIILIAFQTHALVVSVSAYTPSPPIDPKDNSECHRHYQHYETILKELRTTATRIADEAWQIQKQNLRSTRAQALYDEAGRVHDRHFDLLMQAGKERQDCFNQVRDYLQSSRIQDSSTKELVLNQAKGTYSYLSKQQAIKFASKKSRSLAIGIEEKNNLARKTKQLSLAKQAWNLINGKGSWQERLSFHNNTAMELNRLRPSGPLSKTLTSGSISIVTKQVQDLINQMNSGFADFDSTSITKGNYVYRDLMRKSSFSLDVKQNNSPSILEGLEEITSNNAVHPTVKYVAVIENAYLTYIEHEKNLAEKRRVEQQRRAITKNKTRGQQTHTQSSNKQSKKGNRDNFSQKGNSELASKCRLTLAQIDEYEKAINKTRPYIDQSSDHLRVYNLAVEGIKVNKRWYNSNCR